MPVLPVSPALDDPPFDGAPDWHVVRTLRDGSPVVVRPVLPEDREELRRELLALSPESRHSRFLGYAANPSDELLTYLTDVDQHDHVALVAVTTSPDLKTERGVGIARFVRLPELEDIAEAAVTVVDDMHRQGVGTALLVELLRAARVRGIKRLRADVLETNQPMRAILARVGAERALGECTEGTIGYDLALDDPPGSRLSASLLRFFDVLRGAAETMAVRFRRSPHA